MLALIAQLGVTMLVSIVGCTLGAAWLGARMGAKWLAVAGFLVGAVAGMQACYRIIRQMTADWPTDAAYEAMRGKAGAVGAAEAREDLSAEVSDGEKAREDGLAGDSDGRGPDVWSSWETKERVDESPKEDE